MTFLVIRYIIIIKLYYINYGEKESKRRAERNVNV